MIVDDCFWEVFQAHYDVVFGGATARTLNARVTPTTSKFSSLKIRRELLRTLIVYFASRTALLLNKGIGAMQMTA